ncbi:uncharacterized protein BDZ99DRAFT_310166 [Mytilinidion resinicola]|uniref:Uncharacterized protein n=1 Tax=Mytilinidion resinicola TaxID=574789 RepID=A0A6A6YR60_9PEZI|nr:uncharacterized protein BDZ99DRAFT_310166 [Mytilinidion resinicola]KAF2810367.1 hypothetical protein BDZ99DRAFT_310166 [Mytilinidion resinicola]
MPDSLYPPYGPRKRASTTVLRETGDHRKKPAKDAPADTGDTTADSTVDIVGEVNTETAIDAFRAEFGGLGVGNKESRAEAFARGNLLESSPRIRRNYHCYSCQCRVRVFRKGSCAGCGHERCPECLLVNS